MNNNQNALIIFAKYPEPGAVKTRLGKTIGNTKSAALYSAMAKYLVNKFADSEYYNTYIFFSPENKKEQVINWINKKEPDFFAQQGNTLGKKISNAFKKCFELQYKNLVIIGTDCIEIEKKKIINSFNLLKENKNQIVLGPSNDGGYYLLGLNNYYDFLFDEIDWSTDRVLKQTLSKIENKKLKYFLLEEKNDIDEIEDIILKDIEKIDIDLASEIKELIN